MTLVQRYLATPTISSPAAPRTSVISSNGTVEASAMVLLNGTIARFDVSVLTALLPPIDATTQVVQPVLFGADDNDPNVLYHYSLTAHAGQWIAVHLAKSSMDAGYLFVNVYGGIRGGIGMTLVHSYLVQQSTAVIRIPCPAEFLRIDVVAAGGDSSSVDCALYVQGVA